MENLAELNEAPLIQKHNSCWENAPEYQGQPLNQDIETDVVIVGGGIAGISIAYCLVNAGKKVILIEKNNIGSGETAHTTAHLVNALDDRYYVLNRIFGEEDTKLIAQSHTKAIDFIEDTIRKEKIDCEFERVDGFLFRHPSDEPDALEKELHAATKAGLFVELLDHIPGMREQGKSLKFHNQAKFHPLKYLNALAGIIEQKGGKIYTNTHADDISELGVVTDKGFIISAAHVVVATNTPVNNKYSMHMKQFAFRTYVIAALVQKNSLPNALWWDTGDMEINSSIPPYHYIRTQAYDEMYDLLICGGEDHPTGLADADSTPEEIRYILLEKWLRARFEVTDIVYRWSGQVMEPMDSIAYIGHNPADNENVYTATGDSGNGMTHGTIAGMLITDLILEIENEWKKIYSPSRFKLFKSGKTLFKEFFSGLKAYFQTYPKHADKEMLMDIPKGEGKIIEMSGEKYGAYCDEQDQFHFVSAECTHLKCTVKWNNDEKSWDCPCHGSRFSYKGKVLNGPANEDLEYHKEDGLRDGEILI